MKDKRNATLEETKKAVAEVSRDNQIIWKIWKIRGGSYTISTNDLMFNPANSLGVVCLFQNGVEK